MSDSPPPLETAPDTKPLAVDRLYRHCDPAELAFETTAELQPLARQPGQERAVDALNFGLAVEHQGYNLYLMGSSGVGKRELLEGILQQVAARADGSISDWCYVNNFARPDHPLVLRLPRGMGSSLRRDMARTVEDLLASLPATFQSEEYQSRAQELGEEFQEEEQAQLQSRLGEAHRRHGSLHSQSSAKQARLEMGAAGLEWEQTLDFLPQQHVMVFRRAASD